MLLRWERRHGGGNTSLCCWGSLLRSDSGHLARLRRRGRRYLGCRLGRRHILWCRCIARRGPELWRERRQRGWCLDMVGLCWLRWCCLLVSDRRFLCEHLSQNGQEICEGGSLQLTKLAGSASSFTQLHRVETSTHLPCLCPMRQVVVIDSPLQCHMLTDADSHVLGWCHVDEWSISWVGVRDP